MDNLGLHPDASRRHWIFSFGLSLLLATIAWYAIREAISFESVVRDVPIHTEVGEDLTVLDQSPEVADVWFRGARDDLVQLDRERIYIEVRPAAPQGAGARQVVRLGPRNVHVWTRARVVRIDPPTVSFSVDRKGQREVTVRPELQDTVPAGYDVASVSCTPATVTLRGPQSLLEHVPYVRTAPIDLQGRVQSFRVRVPLVPPPDIPSARLEPDRVVVDVQLVEGSDTREFPDIPVMLLARPGKLCAVEIHPATVTITLQGRPEALARAGGLLGAVVEAVDLEPGQTYEVRVRALPPPGTRVVNITPSAVQVVVRP